VLYCYSVVSSVGHKIGNKLAITIRYNTIAEFNVDSKAEYTA